MRNRLLRARFHICLLLLLALAPVRAHAGGALDAVASGDAAELSAALSSGADVNERGREGETVLHAAVRRERADMVRLLLEHGASVDAVNDWRETPLSLAILNYRKELDLDTVQLLLDHGADPDLLKWSEKAAFFGGKSEMPLMRMLVKAGFTPTEGFIVQMADHGSLEAARYVFSRPYDITIKGKAYEILRLPGVGVRQQVADAITMGLKGRGRIALDRARWDGKLPEFIALLEQGADPNGVGSGGSAPILLSEVGKGRKEYVRALLEHGADVDATDYPGHTALWEAVKTNDCDMIRLLIEHGADPEHRDKGGRTPMDIAAYGDRNEARLCLEELTGRKITKPGSPVVSGPPAGSAAKPADKAPRAHAITQAQLPPKDSQPPTFRYQKSPNAAKSPAKPEPSMPKTPKLRAIAERANDALINEILLAIERHDNANLQDPHERNVLFRLIYLKIPAPEDAFRTLAGMGTDIDIVGQDQLTPLLYAIKIGNIDAARALLALGAKTEIPDKSPNALHFALSRKRFQAARLLLDSGVDVNAPGPNRDSPLHQACMAAPGELIADMLTRGAQVNAREKTGLTPLHVAAFRGDPEIVRILLDAGADPAVKDANGHTAKDWAVAQHHDEAAGLL